MTEILLIKHANGAPGLRLCGLGPYLLPSQGLKQLKLLLEKHTFWAKGRSEKQLRRLLAGSTVVVSLWRGKTLVAFGRATSDGIYRAVLWDIVVAGDCQRLGLGRKIVDTLRASPLLKNVEKTYLMTTNESEFYLQLGFNKCEKQNLLCIDMTEFSP